MLDEGTPVGAGVPFSDRGYQVINFTDVLQPGRPDNVVVETAIANRAMLIAIDRDMKQFRKRSGRAEQVRYPNLHLLSLSCSPVQAQNRIAHAMSFIEHEWAFACQKAARAIWLDIGSHSLTSNR